MNHSWADVGLSDYENELVEQGFSPVAGADEAGRGACAGPLVAAACILGDDPIEGLADSKKLTPKRRAELKDEIVAKAASWKVVRVEADEIDRIGLQKANLTALRDALEGLSVQPKFGIIDGFSISGLSFDSLGMWKADQLIKCVSAASILAKVFRDEIMVSYDKEFPEYGFAKHKGYVTRLHSQALAKFGPCSIHRMSYGNVAQARLDTL